MSERDDTQRPKGRSEAEASRAFAVAGEAALADLEQRVSLGMGPLEQALAARIRGAIAQLLACADQLSGDELMIRGSTGQRRPHPLLKTLADLRREIADALKELTFRAEQRATVERSNQAIRTRRLLAQRKDET